MKYRITKVKMDDYFELPNPGLRTYFYRTVKGNPDEYRTPFYKGLSVQQVLSKWTPTLETISSKYPGMYNFENDLAKKVGPMSIQKPLSERMDSIFSYYEFVLPDSEPVSEEAIRAVIAEWSKVGTLQIRSQAHTVDIMKKSTNSGPPYFTKRRAVVQKTIPAELSMEDDIYVVQVLVGKRWYACAILGWRGQEGGPSIDDVKQRDVWMFPFAVNVEELRFYQVLIEAAQLHNIVPAWVGMESVDREVTQLFDTKGANDLVICTDFSKFDQHFNRRLQDAAKQIFTSLLGDTPESRYWLNEVFPIKFMIPLMINWGEIITGEHGMGSGSGGTNGDETPVHRALQHEVAISHGTKLNPHSQCLGDDGILTYPGITVEDVMQSYTKHGLEMNPDKQYASKHDCIYLRRYHSDTYRENGICVGVYSTYRAIGRLCEQERYYDPDKWGAKMVALRQLSIIENCKYHPLFKEFVQFCMKGDKYRLGLDITGFLDNIDRIAGEAIDLMPDFLGYTKSLGKDAGTGLSDWRVVKYLKSLA